MELEQERMLTWNNICQNPQLQDLPFKIETDEWGKIIMAPVKVRHSGYQWKIQYWIYHYLKNGEVIPECAIHTKKGTKVADVAWCSPELWEKIRDEDEATIAPEICVEVLSESNTKSEMIQKQQLYFDVDAKEVWICDLNGKIEFFDPSGELRQSNLVPLFPHEIQV